MNKRWLFIAAGLAIVLMSITLTLVIMTFSKSSDEDSSSNQSRRYDVFEGYSLCEDTIKSSVGGKVLSLNADDRAAKYERNSNTNMLYFVVHYQKKVGLFGGTVAPEEKVFVRCDVSARTNEVEAIRVRPAEEEHYTEVHRKQ